MDWWLVRWQGLLASAAPLAPPAWRPLMIRFGSRVSRDVTTAGRLATVWFCSLFAVGCAMTPDHMLGSEESVCPHAWHQVPGKVGFAIAVVPLMVVCSPVILVEELAGGRSMLSKTGNGVSTYLVGVPAMAVGYLFALPFFVVGLPWERCPFEAPEGSVSGT